MLNRNNVIRQNLTALIFSISFGLTTFFSGGTSSEDFNFYQNKQPVVKVADGGAITLPPLPNHGG